MSVQVQERAATVHQNVVPQNRRSMLDLWSMRHLIGVMVRRDLLGQYRGSVMGFFWTIINPLGHLLLYTFVFSVVLKVRFGASADTGTFALYLMAGLLPWGALAESINRGISSVSDQPNLVKRVVFPLEILPLSAVLSAIISECIGLSILICIAAFSGHPPKPSLVFLPLVLAAQFLFMSGLAWLVGSLGVYIRDLRHMTALGLSVWMYASPVVYPASALPQQFSFLLWINPMAGMLTDYRRILLEGLPPDWLMFASYATLGACLWVFGYLFFKKMKRSFADVM